MSERQGGSWRGHRGEWYVVAQVVFMALIFFGPRSSPSLPVWPLPTGRGWIVLGVLLMLLGGSFLIISIAYLRSALTPLPYPTARGTLIQSGPYAVVRHPMYAGGLVLAFGWALLVRGWLTLVYVLLFAVFVTIKCRREERWLRARYPEYPAYETRVRRLIPFVY